jgi:hypothetical protein
MTISAIYPDGRMEVPATTGNKVGVVHLKMNKESTIHVSIRSQNAGEQPGIEDCKKAAAVLWSLPLQGKTEISKTKLRKLLSRNYGLLLIISRDFHVYDHITDGPHGKFSTKDSLIAYRLFAEALATADIAA